MKMSINREDLGWAQVSTLRKNKKNEIESGCGLVCRGLVLGN